MSYYRDDNDQVICDPCLTDAEVVLAPPLKPITAHQVDPWKWAPRWSVGHHTCSRCGDNANRHAPLHTTAVGRALAAAGLD